MKTQQKVLRPRPVHCAPMRTAVIALIALSTSVSAQWTQPLDVRNHRSADLVFLRLTPRSGVVPHNARTLSYSFVVSNEFRLSGPIDEDSETARLMIVYRQGLTDGWEAFVEVPLVSRGGGFLDPLIDWWHAAILGDPNPVRDATAKGRSIVSFPGGGPFGSATGIGDITIGVAHSVTDSAVARAAIKLPTGNAAQLIGSGGFDAALALDWRRRLTGALLVDLHGAYVLQGNPTELVGARRAVYASSVSLTWLLSSRDALTAQWSTERSPTKTGTTVLDKDHRVVSFGYQRKLDRDTVLQLYFSEDGDFRSVRFPGGATTGPDFTIGIRLIQLK